MPTTTSSSGSDQPNRRASPATKPTTATRPRMSSAACTVHCAECWSPGLGGQPTSCTWCSRSCRKYRPSVSTVNIEPLERRPGRVPLVGRHGAKSPAIRVAPRRASSARRSPGPAPSTARRAPSRPGPSSGTAGRRSPRISARRAPKTRQTSRTWQAYSSGDQTCGSGRSPRRAGRARHACCGGRGSSRR